MTKQRVFIYGIPGKTISGWRDVVPLTKDNAVVTVAPSMSKTLSYEELLAYIKHLEGKLAERKPDDPA